MEPETRGECPACHRVALLRHARKRVTRRADRQASGRSIPPLASAFFTALGPARRVIIAVGVVVSVLGLLSLKSSSFIPTQSAPTGRSNVDVASRELAVLQTALTQFTADCGRAPTDEEGLLALLNNPGLFGWKASYVTLLRPDPWGHWYVYRRSATNQWELLSLGPDGIEGTADDLRTMVERLSPDNSAGSRVDLDQ